MSNSQTEQDKFEEFKLNESEKIKQEGIIDQFIVKYIAFNILPSLKKANITPNMVTTFSLIISCISIWNIHKDKYIIGSLLFLIRYILDCIDGPLARYTKTVTKFGDVYDHVVDLGTVIAFFIVAFTKKYSKKFYIGCIILFITTFIHHSIIAQRNTHQSDFISSMLQFIPIDANKFYWTQYLSTDITIVYMCIGILFLNKNIQKIIG